MRHGIVALLCSLLIPSAWTAATPHERPDWAQHFAAHQAVGTLVVADRRNGRHELMVFDVARAAQAFPPASTYKIPHTLFALDAGAVRDEFQVFRWDGRPRAFAGHNQDQALRTAMRHSTVWVYEDFARAIGTARARTYLERSGYGNADPEPDSATEPYWIDGKLRISAFAQIDFLERLYRNALPFAAEHQRLVKDLIVIAAGRDWILRAKTGWSGRIGWWVGWVERAEGPVFFALNIDTPQRLADLPKREAVTRAVLRTLDALPADAP